MSNSFKYKVTMIVPIYNMENFLRDCLQSLVEQTIDLNEMEILLIDDGSPDNSIDIMTEFADKYPCMKILRKENEGLSMTRNYGIERAQGKYIMYIDADDTITPETIKSVTDFFDKHYDEVDLVAYPEQPIINGEVGQIHYRYKTLVKSGIYDLTKLENAFITQTRINVCVKNMPGENVLFDFDRTFRHEDQKYCTQVLQKKMKIGFCEKGMYNYLHQPDSIVRTYFYAYYIFESTMRFWEEIFACYPYNEVPYYIQSLYLNDVSWKIKGTVLYPYHYNEEELAKAQGRVQRLLDQVSDEVIIRHPGIDNFQRQYYISQKKDNDIKMFFGNDDLAVLNHEQLIFYRYKMEIDVSRIRIKNDKMYLTAFIKNAALNYLDKPRLYVVKNNDMDNKEEVELQLSTYSYYKAKIVTNRFWMFTLTIDANEVKNFKFVVDVDGHMMNTNYYFQWHVLFGSGHKRKVFFRGNKKYSFRDNVFYIDKKKDSDYKKHLKYLRNRYKGSLATRVARNICTYDIKAFENVWLYYDCKGIRKDNGYYQFDHDFNKKDGVARYYVVNEENFDEVIKEYPKNQRSHIVKFGGKFHRFLYLKASKIITAYIERNNYFPFDAELYKKYADVCNIPELIYLQHGVLHAHLPWKYSYDRLGIDKEVISTTFERENLTSQYCFPEDALIQSGMPRYAFMDTKKAGSLNRILFAPSWRKYLIGMVGTEWVATENKFLNSAYYAETSAFLNSPELEKMLTEHDMYLDFKLHPIFERYKHLYNITNSRVTLAESKVSETQYKVFMTDFSSFVFDFVYLNLPIIYFMPDYDMFRAGMNDYRALDIPFEDAFGDFVENAEEALVALDKILKNDCKVEEKYAKKMENFFLYKDMNSMDRIYEALMK